MAELGERIRTLRKRYGLTQGELADKAGVTTSFISSVERGEKMPRIENLEKIGRAFGVSPALLLDGTVSVEKLTEISSILIGLQQLDPEQVDIVLAMIDQMIRA